MKHPTKTGIRRKRKSLPYPFCDTPALANVLGSFTRAYAVQYAAANKRPINLSTAEWKRIAYLKQAGRSAERQSPDGIDPASTDGASQKSEVERQLTPCRTLAGSIAD